MKALKHRQRVWVSLKLVTSLFPLSVPVSLDGASSPPGSRPQSATSKQPVDGTDPFPNLTDDEIRQGFETLLGTVPRGSHPGVQQFGFRGFFKQKVEEMQAQDLFLSSVPASADDEATERARALSSSPRGEEENDPDWEPWKGSAGGGKDIRAPGVRSGPGTRGRAALPRVKRKEERPDPGATHPKNPWKKQALERRTSANEASGIIEAMLRGWEGVPVDSARRAFEKLNGWSPDESAMKSRCVDLRAWYRSKFERMLQSERRFVRFSSNTSKKYEYKWEPWGRAQVSVGDWIPRGGEGKLEREEILVEEMESGTGPLGGAGADVRGHAGEQSGACEGGIERIQESSSASAEAAEAEGTELQGAEAEAKSVGKVRTGPEAAFSSPEDEATESKPEFVSCLAPSEAVESARALLDTWTPDALDEARGLFYMVNGWLPDEDDLAAGEVSEWFRTKLERLGEAGERCFKENDGEALRFVAWSRDGVGHGEDERIADEEARKRVW